MFSFGKKKKSKKLNPAENWNNEMKLLYENTDLTAYLTSHQEESLAFGLGYLSEYLKVNRAKDKITAEIEQQFLMDFGHLSAVEAETLRKRIVRTTSSSEPLFFEMIFTGVETYQLSQQEGADLLTCGQKIKDLLTNDA